MVNLKLWAYTGVTLKALANVSPGPGSPCGQPARGGSVCFETLGSKVPEQIGRNPERFARFCG